MDPVDLLRAMSNQSHFVIDTSYALNTYIPVNLSITNCELADGDISSPDSCQSYIKNHLAVNQGKVAFGGYLEERNLYSGEHNFIGSEERTIHLGIDFWCEEGTKVLAVMDGEIHSFRNNLNPGDYGPTIVLKHNYNDIEFHSLYGHLSLESLIGLGIGQKIAKEAKIGTIGSPQVNGGYAPHLHFQLITDMQGSYGDYPGVCRREDLAFYKENCPDPNLVLNYSI